MRTIIIWSLAIAAAAAGECAWKLRVLPAAPFLPGTSSRPFRYSMNGKVPKLGDPVLVALESYSYFLAKGLPTGEVAPGKGFRSCRNRS